ncbi:hypothetical protein POM88_031087 [Heracleum sosnowskyi]|uniref:Uncharacterized protein n=1 Tax=Heracleum sosnowskyi TaxID=360622 RepID=A0AAD8HXZ5_9APIA|nr:hypothetical protein POM88_031087 [Heracleum sosnowskyi]
MQYIIDLRFIAPVLNNILIYLLKYSSLTDEGAQANQMLIWDYFINVDQHGWFYAILAFLLLLFLISTKLTISITVFAQPIILRFGNFNLSVPLVFLMMASFVFPPQILFYAYLLICLLFWISPFPSHVFEKIMNWLQQIRPIFIVMAQQHDHNDLQAPVHQYFEIDDDEDDDENFEINVIFGHA